MIRCLLLLALLSAPAWAQKVEEAAPAAEPANDARLEGDKLDTAGKPARSAWLVQAGAGAGAALVSVPAALYLGAWLGSLSNSIIWSIVPSFLVMALVPSLVVAWMVTRIGDLFSPGTFRFWPTFGITLAVNILALVVGGVAGLSVGVFARVLVFTVAEAIVLPAAATGASQLFKRKSEPSGAQAWLSRDPRSPTTWVIPTGEVSF